MTASGANNAREVWGGGGNDIKKISPPPYPHKLQP